MYGADWCGDCIRAKAFFTENDIAFDYVDLVEHPDETNVILELNGGVQKIPLIMFPDESFLIEPTNAELEAKISELTATDSSDAEVIENVAEQRFELVIDGAIVSTASYSEREDGTVIVPHVQTDPARRGQGNAGRLMDGLLDNLRATQRRIVPACPFAATHIEENEQYRDLVA